MPYAAFPAVWTLAESALATLGPSRIDTGSGVSVMSIGWVDVGAIVTLLVAFCGAIYLVQRDNKYFMKEIAGGIQKSVDKMDENMNRRMSSMDENMNRRMSSMDENMNRRMSSMEKRLDRLENSVETVGKDVVELKERVKAVEVRLDFMQDAQETKFGDQTPKEDRP